ncbi:MAG: cytochrome oxidase putative small subunit CydP [Rhodoferax sp.]|jgi:hypothetical protein|uniref:cytochrome oxidase putative small subunit CydP n=1 Tax=Rhodoferax sp. TaxID=50421 RepID=UPI003BB75383|nr:hypothetical protein [Rhodoferax sp.]
MKLADQILVKKLAVVLAIKLVLLYGLWWGFVRDQRVTVDASGMAAQALVPGFEIVKGENK